MGFETLRRRVGLSVRVCVGILPVMVLSVSSFHLEVLVGLPGQPADCCEDGFCPMRHDMGGTPDGESLNCDCSLRPGPGPLLARPMKPALAISEFRIRPRRLFPERVPGSDVPWKKAPGSRPDHPPPRDVHPLSF